LRPSRDIWEPQLGPVPPTILINLKYIAYIPRWIPMKIDPFGIRLWVGVELSLCFLLRCLGLELLEVGWINSLYQWPQILDLLDRNLPWCLLSAPLGSYQGDGSRAFVRPSRMLWYDTPHVGYTWLDDSPITWKNEYAWGFHSKLHGRSFSYSQSLEPTCRVLWFGRALRCRCKIGRRINFANRESHNVTTHIFSQAQQ